MKIYTNPELLQKIIKENCSKQFEHLFSSNVILKFKCDEENNLILDNKEGGTIQMDSTISYLLSDYYKTVGDALKRIETITEQQPEDKYNGDKGLGILFYKPFISFVSKEFKYYHGDGTYMNREE